MQDTQDLWVNLTATELVFANGLGIALVVLAILGRHDYLLQEGKLSEREKKRCHLEHDLFRRIRLWGGFFLLGIDSALCALLQVVSLPMNVFLNLSSISLLTAFMFISYTYLKYMVFTYVVDLLAALGIVELISLRKRE